MSPLVRFIICPEGNQDNTPANVQQMLDETWDVVESPAFAAALEQSLNESFLVLSDQFASGPFARSDALAVSSPGRPGQPQFYELTTGTVQVQTSMPLARLAIHMKPSKTCLNVTTDGICTHARAISELPVVQELLTALVDM